LIAALDPRPSGVARVIAATGGVIVTIFLTLKTLQRLAPGSSARVRGPSGIIDVLARYPVARGQQLVLLSLGRRILLVHQSGSTMSPLAELTDEAEAASLRARLEADERERRGQGFSAALRGFGSSFRSSSAASPSDLLPVAPGEVQMIDLTRSSRPARGHRRDRASGAAR